MFFFLLMGILYIFWIWISWWLSILQISFLSLSLPFHFLNSFFWPMDILDFKEVQFISFFIISDFVSYFKRSLYISNHEDILLCFLLKTLFLTFIFRCFCMIWGRSKCSLLSPSGSAKKLCFFKLCVNKFFKNIIVYSLQIFFMACTKFSCLHHIL